MLFPFKPQGRVAFRRSRKTPRSGLFRVESLETRCLLSADPGRLVITVNPLPMPTPDLVSIVTSQGASLSATTLPDTVQATGTPSEIQTLLPILNAIPGVTAVEGRIETITQTPNDPYYLNNSLYGLNGTNGINAPTAWNVSTGSKTVIASIDTGVDYNHPDLYQNIWINQPEIPLSRMKNLVDVYHDGYISWRDLNNPVNIGPGKITDVNGDGVIDAGDILSPMILDANGNDTGTGGWANAKNVQDGDTAHPDDLIGWNFINNTNNPMDDNGHGTHTTGIMAAMGNNGVGVTGVNWYVQVMVLKFLDATGSGSDTAAAEAVQYATLHGAKASNNSYGDTAPSAVVETAVQNAQAAGSIFVAAAGNSGTNNDTTPFYPASLTEGNVVAVAATDQNGIIASFSDYGVKSVKLGAPGVNILSTFPSGQYGDLSGTSMAAPYVTGAVALLEGIHPTWTYTQIINQILSTVTPDPSLVGKTVAGGILNIGAAMSTNTGWNGYANDPQHTAMTSVAAQSLSAIHWQTTIDSASQSGGGEIFAHYGTPLITGANTVIVPITNPSGTYSVDAINGVTGTLLWAINSDYTLPAHDWVPPFGMTLATVPGPAATTITRLYLPGADGSVLYVDNPDNPAKNSNGSVVTGRLAFYGLTQFNTDQANGNANIEINTPITADNSGNIYFGYQVSGTNAANLANGIATISSSGVGQSVAVSAVSQVANFNKVATNSAPAISNNGSALYIAVCSSTQDGSVADSHFGELLELSTSNLSFIADAALLEPAGTANAGQPSIVTGDSSSTPTVGPDGDVYFGVLEHTFASNHDRGWLLHFSGDLSQTKDAGFFGWDDTASIVPASLVPSYTGTSTYLLMTKYNNYAGAGGNGINQIAILDPDTRDPGCPTGMNMMNVVATLTGPTPDPTYDSTFPGAVKEWCINSAAVDVNPATHSIYANSEDGKLYRWDLYNLGTYSQVITLTAGIGEAYTPTAIGPDGTVYAINDAILFAVGNTTTTPPAATVTFVKLDTSTQGTWKTAYGADGFDLAQDPSSNNPSIPTYATVTVSNASNYVWNASTTDPRALQKAATTATDRIAAGWYSSANFSVDVHLTDGKSHQIAIYALDYDNNGRDEIVQVVDDATGTILDTRTLTAFQGGDYLVWNVQGNVTFKVTNNGSTNALLNAIFFGGVPTTPPSASASFLKLDTTTQGTWKSAYGADGFDIAQDPSSNNPSIPAYATVTLANTQNATWTGSTSDPRALQKAATTATDRIAAAWVTSSSFTIDVHLTDGNKHQIALYALDFDNSARTETVQVVDDVTGTILDTRTLTAFQGGDYLVWNIQGNVTFKVTNTSSTNAVVSGLFFGGAPNISPSGSAGFLNLDTTTQGTWKPVYGADGFEIAQDPSANNPSIPSYATITFGNVQNAAWSGSTSDPRALQKAAPTSTDRIAACWVSGSSFTIDIHLTDGKTHQIALYALDFDKNGRNEIIQAIDDVTGTVLDTRTVTQFQGGDYLVWNVQGNVTFKITNNGSTNAVISGIFFGGVPTITPVATASFLKLDTTTQGTWKPVYGGEGFDLAQDPSTNNPSIPSYATVTITNNLTAVWAGSTADVRALQKADPIATDRIAAAWFAGASFNIDVHMTDGNTHQIALYALDYDNNGRNETVQVLDDATGAVLNTQTIGGFQGGDYLVWNIKGNVTFRVTNNGSSNAVINGLFFGGAPTTSPAASVSFLKQDNTTQGTWKNTYGKDGFDIALDSSSNNPSIPSYAAVTIANAVTAYWSGSTTDPRALQKADPNSTDRIAACWVSGSSFTMDVKLTDGNTHQVGLYAMDYDNNGRNETIQVIDDVTGTVLDTRNLSAFQGGSYLVWNVKGSVTFKITNNGSTNAVISGLFFDPSA